MHKKYKKIISLIFIFIMFFSLVVPIDASELNGGIIVENTKPDEDITIKDIEPDEDITIEDIEPDEDITIEDTEPDEDVTIEDTEPDEDVLSENIGLGEEIIGEGIEIDEVAVAESAEINEIIENTEPIIIEFSVPTTTSFALDPNTEYLEDRFIAPIFTIKNTCNTPLKVEVESIMLAVDSPHTFLDVPPNEYTPTQWERLNASESESKIALGLTVRKTGWGEIFKTDALYVTECTTPTAFGIVNPGQDAEFALTAMHGNSFSKKLNVKYIIKWRLSPSDE